MEILVGFLAWLIIIAVIGIIIRTQVDAVNSFKDRYRRDEDDNH